jgi:hypothetical protein
MRAWLLICISLIAAGTVRGGGLAHDNDFVVLAPDQDLADAVLAKAVQFRREIAVEWLEEELPPSVGRVTIHVEISQSGNDQALFWPMDSAERTMHKLWLTCPRDLAVGSTLAHEMTHVVLATRFGRRLPAWCDEGMASLNDDAERQKTRADILAWYVKTDNWPDLKAVLSAETISANDRARYSMAASVTKFLLTKGSKQEFLAFAVDGQANGWDAALANHYQMASVADLQSEWQAWVGRTDVALHDVSGKRTQASTQ